MRQAGFTLVETAIVLVIVGLLVGIILKGQEMITQAKIKNLVADFSGVSAAYYGYQDRYRAVPGDDAGAARWAGASAGNGDGRLAGAYNSATATEESRLWWDHLRRAGFVAGNGTRQPNNPLNGMLGVQTGDAAGGPALGGLVRVIVCSANLPGRFAIGADTQMDDGAGTSGTVRGLAQTVLNQTVDNASVATTYNEADTSLYVLCREL
jgi:prepilin-type N-terminal cleavage/methylation domain-containing protein